MNALSGRSVRVEALGVLCPVPIIRLARAARSLPAGSVLELVSDDPAAAHDVPAWCRLRGHTLLSVTPYEDVAPHDEDGPASSSDRPSPHPGPEPDVGTPPTPHPLRHVIRLEAAEPGI